jgi:hypothetical protein
MYIRCSCCMFRPHMDHHQETLWEATALYTLSLVPSGTSSSLIWFVGYFHIICFSGRFSVHLNTVRQLYIITYLGCVIIDGVWIGYGSYWPLTHNSELQVTTAPPLISTIHKSPQHPLSLLQPAVSSTSRSLVRASNSRGSSGSRSQVLLSQPTVQNSC